ncbi:MAG: hypothetical protein LUC93_04685 [Planctomycetaceae bacterium]|nr:hypothetical protein [Planctomycetaceae bacterium]
MAAVRARAEYAQIEARLQAVLRGNPDDQEALRALALAAIERGDFRAADSAYSRLLALSLDNPAAAIPYMLGKWHVTQEFEAQAWLIRAESEGSISAGNQRLVAESLDEIYNPASLITALRREMTAPDQAVLLDALEEQWLATIDTLRTLEVGGDVDALEGAMHSFLGDFSAENAFLSVWRAFALIRQNDRAAAEAHLQFAARTAAGNRTKHDVAIAVDLIQQIWRRPLSNEYLEGLSGFIRDVSSTIGGQMAESIASADSRLNDAQQLLDDRNFDAAWDLLDEIRPGLSDAALRQRHLYLTAEALWGRLDFARANQGYIASAVQLRERYFVSISLSKMAEYSAMLGDREQAAEYAVRSAGLLRDQAWKLRQTGEFFMNLDMPERGIAYIERSIDVSDSLAEDALSFSSLAEAYKRIGERDRYLEYARDYIVTIETVEDLDDVITPHQDGMRHYYHGELLAEERQYDEAYASYEQASVLITEPFRLSDVLMAMANLKARAGEMDAAETLAVQVGELLPDQDWRLRDVGNLLMNIGQPAKAVPYFDKALETARTTQGRARSLASLSDVYNRLQNRERAENYSRQYIDFVKAHSEDLTDDDIALAAYYQGEIYNYQGEPHRAYPEFERAARLFDDRYRRAEALMRMADYQAAHGTKEQASSLAEASVALAPDEWWKLREAGIFFLRIDMPDKAMEYFARASLNDPTKGRADEYAMMADAYKTLGNPERYIHFMREYIAAIGLDGRTPTRDEEGLAAYYDGEIKLLDGKPDEAFSSYERASELITDGARLATVLMQMAEYQAGQGDKAQALTYASRSAEARPDADKLRQVGEFLVRIDMPEEAIPYFERYARLVSSAEQAIDVYAAVAENYKRAGNRENYLLFARRYVDAVDAAESEFSPAERGQAEFYRGEIASAEERREDAYAAYESASTLITERYLLSETFMRMAEAKAALSDIDEAVALAKRSAESLPNEPWKLRQVADFLMDLNRPLEANEYIQRYLASPGDGGPQGAMYAAWAESFKRLNNQERYLQLAAEYVRLIEEREDSSSSAEKGLAAYFQGELHAAAGDAGLAYTSYQKAVGLVEDAGRLFEIYSKMAEYQASLGDTEKAAELLQLAVQSLPVRDNRYRNAADLAQRIERPDLAERYYEALAGFTEGGQGDISAYATLAEMYRERGDTRKYLQYAGRYVTVASVDASVLSPDQAGMAEYYRGEIHAAAGEKDLAFAAYERASLSLSDRGRLADVFEKMAVIEAERGNRERAAELIARAAGLFPSEGWRVGRAADAFNRLDMPEQSISLYRQRLAMAGTPRERAEAYRALAETYARIGDAAAMTEAAKQYVAIVSQPTFNPTDYESAMRAYYQGELATQSGMPDKALAAYEEAAELFTDNYMKSESFIKIATILADRGDLEASAAMVEKSTALVPENEWRMQQAADLYSRLNMPQKAFDLYERKLALASTLRAKAAAYQSLADLYQRLDDTDKFMQAAENYIAIIESGDFEPSRDEEAYRAYYQGEIYSLHNDPEAALAAYGEAAELFSGAYMQAETYVRMAILEAEHGNREHSVALMEKALSLDGESGWRLQQAADLYVRVGMREAALEYYDRRLSMADTPGEKAQAFNSLAQYYVNHDPEEYRRYANEYIAAVSEPGFVPSKEQRGRMVFYQGELLRLDDRTSDAIDSYEIAAELVTDTYFLSEILVRIANLEIARGNTDKALQLADRSMAMYPNDIWRVIDAAQVYLAAGVPEKSIAAFRRLENLDSLSRERWLIYRELANAYRQTGEDELYRHYGEKYIEAIGARKDATEGDRALAHFFTGDILKEDGDLDGALAAYESALRLYATDPYRRSETALTIATAYSQRGDTKKAIEYAELSVKYAPHLPDRIRLAGDFLVGLDKTERALELFFSILPLAQTDREQAVVFESIAKAYKRRGMDTEFVRYATEYYLAIDRLGVKATQFDRAHQSFYLGEIHSTRKEDYQAYLAYEQASLLYTEPFYITEALLPMARYNLTTKNKKLAAQQARRVADLLLDQGWRVRDAASILDASGNRDEAIAVLERAIRLNPRANVSLYRDLSPLYVQAKNKKAGIAASETYIDHLYGQVASEGPDSSTARIQELWDARNRHGGLLRPLGLGLESYQFFRRNDDGSYSITTSHELARYYYINRRLRGKIFATFADTLFALNKGRWEAPGGDSGEWEAYQHFGEGATLMLGFSVEPFFKGILSDLSINFEYITGLGKNKYEDWRIRPVYDRAVGDEIRPFGTHWPYWKLYSAVVYSIRQEDIISYGTFRGGHTWAVNENRNLLIMPYGTVNYRYGGKNMDKGERWGSSIGFGIAFKKYFREGRYHLPMANVEFDFYYHKGLTKGMMDTVGLTISSNF